MSQSNLLSFAEAELAGRAMYDRWRREATLPPPLDREDAAWADLARVAWEAVHGARIEAALTDRPNEGGKRGCK